jgi:MFS family permease
VSALPAGHPAAYDVGRVQRRTLWTLVSSQALGGLGMTIGIALATVLAEDVSGSDTLAGLASTTQVVGAAAASYLLARVSGRRGRRAGLVSGYLAGVAGAALCVAGGVWESYPVLLVGSGLLGGITAAGLQSRYAAVDLAVPTRRGRSLSLVVWSTTVGAVLGPNLVGVAGDVGVTLGLPRLTGGFALSVVIVAAAAGVLQAFLRPDPLLLARRLAGHAEHARHHTSWAAVLAVVRARPPLVAAVAALAAAHAVMVAVMVMTPLHMHHGGASLEVIGLVISVHVLGMFFLSPLVGVAADRAGPPLVLAVGGVVLVVALLLAGGSPMGASPRIGVGLFLLGLGWSCCTVAAATLVAAYAPLDVRTDVQGAADLVMNLVAAGGAAAAGLVVERLGYPALNGFAGVLVVAVAAAAVVSRRPVLH